MPINIDGSKGIRQNTTEVTKIPVGTTAQRPDNPAAGMIRFNTDRGLIEWYDPAVDLWKSTDFYEGVAATGGTVTDITQDGKKFRVHTFTSDGTFEVTRGGEVEYLVVAGGGAGGAACGNGGGGGGGAGGYRSSVTNEPSGGGASSEPKFTVTANTYSVVVGAGGSNVSGSNTVGNDGSDSQFANITSIGGGGGGVHQDNSARDGGSGGGSGGFVNDSGRVGGAGTTGQGFRGADGAYAGAGGASERGQSGFEDGTRGNGGDGVESSIDGSATFRAGGGGGANRTTTPVPPSADGAGGFGGAGGGGDGSLGPDDNGLPGAANTGGGGGGTRCGTSGAGGSGIVIVRYRIG